MCKRAAAAGLIAFGLFGAAWGRGASVAESDELAAAARRFVGLLQKEQFSAAVESFDDTMQKAMPAEKLEKVWASVIARTGPLKRQAGIQKARVEQFDIVVVTCEFDKGSLDVKVVFDRAGAVTGLWFAPAGSSAKYEPPPYVKRDSFEEKEVRVRAGLLWPLPGTLTLPVGEGPFPAVVLVHGSGPHDRDETIGPNKPFRDLAWGLASRGIAVLRYEKRTKEHKGKLLLMKDRITVKEETTDDALAAVSLLRKTEKIDAQRIFVLGHSLGGMLLPRIAAGDPEIAGLIVLAGTTRPLEDVFLDQRTWFASLDGEVSEEEKARLEELNKQVARVKDANLSAATPSEDLPAGIAAAYWLDLRGYDPPQAAKGLPQPLLVLQGARDYQVTLEDFEGWKRALSGRQGVAFKLYPQCNHLFVEGEGQSTPAEYQTPGHVAQVVVDDVAAWIGGAISCAIPHLSKKTLLAWVSPSRW